jgi:hypothetical protein
MYYSHITEEEKRCKLQESIVEKLLKDNNIEYKREYRITFRHIGLTYARVDFIININGVIICLEVDENQHIHYRIKYEVNRMYYVYKSLMMNINIIPIVFIRYNPHGYKINGMTKRTTLEERHEKLIETIKYALTLNDNAIIYLFYNMDNQHKPIILSDPSYDESTKLLVHYEDVYNNYQKINNDKKSIIDEKIVNNIECNSIQNIKCDSPKNIECDSTQNIKYDNPLNIERNKPNDDQIEFLASFYEFMFEIKDELSLSNKVKVRNALDRILDVFGDCATRILQIQVNNAFSKNIQPPTIYTGNYDPHETVNLKSPSEKTPILNKRLQLIYKKCFNVSQTIDHLQRTNASLHKYCVIETSEDIIVLLEGFKAYRCTTSTYFDICVDSKIVSPKIYSIPKNAWNESILYFKSKKPIIDNMDNV